MSMFYDADRYFNYKENWLLNRPKCDRCGEHIQDEKCLDLPNGEKWCQECENEFAKELWFEFSHEDYLVDTERD